MLAYLEVGERIGMPALLAQLVEMQYERTKMDLARGTFRVRGDVLEIHPAYEDMAMRVEFFGDEIEKITRTDPCAARRSRGWTGSRSIPAPSTRRRGRRSSGRSGRSGWSSTSGWPS